jgi:stage III sporulation protein AA
MMHLNSGWNAFLKILPPHIAAQADQYQACAAQELRLRLDRSPILKTGTGDLLLQGRVTANDLNFCVNTATRYSPWASATVREGYLSIPGGHRIGLCGEVIRDGKEVKGIRSVESLCIRIARDVQGLLTEKPPPDGSVLILGAPGWGKTTLLRELSRKTADLLTTVVVDERGELFPEGFTRGVRMDVLYLCPKASGVDMALRTMGPQVIAVDEITAQEDSDALCYAANCGVRLLATAHASSQRDLLLRPIYRKMMEQSVFSHILQLKKDKSWRMERVMQ